MPKNTLKNKPDRDLKESFLDLSTLGYVPPNVGIFDEPARCYRLNAQWAKIVFGWLDWLADTQCWQGTDEQRYNAVRELLRFFIAQECGTMADCADLADCIENDPNLQLVLQQLINDTISDVVPNHEAPISEDRRETNLMPSDAGCDLDTQFGIVSGLVDFLHSTALDILQILEVITDPNEQLVRLSEGIPVLAQLINWTLGTLEALQDTVFEVYQASYTPSVRDKIRCSLFCNAKEGCALSLEDIVSTYSALAGVDISGVTSLDAALEVLLQVVRDAPLKIVAAFHWFLVQAFRYGSSVFGFDNFYSLKTAMELAANNPDSDHEILCTSCIDEFWEHTADFLSSLGGYQLVQGQYIAGAVKGVVVDPDAKQCQVTLQLPETIRVRGVEINFHVNSTPGGQENVISCRLRPIIGSNDGSNLIIVTNYGTTSGPKVRCQVRGASIGTFMCREIVVILRIGHNVNQTGDCFLDKIRVWGEGTPTPPNGITSPSQPQCTP